MATQAYFNWLKAGEPYQLAEWMADLVDTMEGHGYVVYHYPDDAHLTTNQPQDHAPFSFTGWPIDSPFGWGFGVDIMPKNGDARSLTALARQIIADKDAGVPELAGLKYINWTDEQGNVWQTSWKPTKATRPNTDKGHIHLSGRSDSAHWRALGYDPIARMNGEDMLTPEEIVNAVVNGSTNHGYIPTGGREDIGAAATFNLRSLHFKVDAAAVEARAERAVIEQLAAVIRAGGGDVDTAALGVKIDAVRTEVEELQRALAEATDRADAAERERDSLLAAAYTASAVPE
jgi:hypothetical protein